MKPEKSGKSAALNANQDPPTFTNPQLLTFHSTTAMLTVMKIDRRLAPDAVDAVHGYGATGIINTTSFPRKGHSTASQPATAPMTTLREFFLARKVP